jgi:hypothetical protein
MDELNKLTNQGRQRAGLLAVIVGVFMSSEDENTKRTMAIVLNQVFEDYPVGDDVEKMTKSAMMDALGKVNDHEAQMKEMLDQINNILRN